MWKHGLESWGVYSFSGGAVGGCSSSSPSIFILIFSLSYRGFLVKCEETEARTLRVYLNHWDYGLVIFLGLRYLIFFLEGGSSF